MCVESFLFKRTVVNERRFMKPFLSSMNYGKLEIRGLYFRVLKFKRQENVPGTDSEQ